MEQNAGISRCVLGSIIFNLIWHKKIQCLRCSTLKKKKLKKDFDNMCDNCHKLKIDDIPKCLELLHCVCLIILHLLSSVDYL